MDPSRAPADNAQMANRVPNPVSSGSAQFAPKAPIPTWSSQALGQAQPSSIPSQNGSGTGPPIFPQFSASTAEILKRLQANPGHAAGTPAFEAKRAEVLQNYVTSDKLPTPPPIANTGRRGRGGRIVTPSTLKSEVGGPASPASGTPTSGRGPGRGRGRGRGSGRGGKRKRAESFDSDDDSDISTSYTPLPTRTKSGRSVNKPVAFVPTLPEPTSGVKRRKSAKQILAAQCKICTRSTDPGNNRIVFCDSCSTAYQQYCHNPPIDNEVVTVLEKEWLCGPCQRSRQNVIEGMDGLTTGEGLSIDDKRAYLSTLPQTRLVSLLLHATIRHPELPLFPKDVQDLIPENDLSKRKLPFTNSALRQPPTPGLAPSHSVTSPPNGVGSTGGTPRSQHLGTDSSEMDPAEAQLLGEIRSHQAQPPSAKPNPLDAVNNQQQLDGYDDGYDTDPPAHYPKAGNGLARTLRPESEDLQWLVDDNFEVFSHGWKGDGSGVGADGTLDAIEGVTKVA